MHPTRLYVPPGELITIDIPSFVVNQLSYSINIQTFNSNSNKQKSRAYLLCQQTLTRTHNTFGWPYGGILCINLPNDKYSSGVEINVSGCIRAPYFLYGQTTDQEWEEEETKYAAPVAVLDNTLIHNILPSTSIRSATRMNDIMGHWRAFGCLINNANHPPNYAPRADGRVAIPIRIQYDKYVWAGEACAWAASNFCQFPYKYDTSVNNAGNLMSGYWGMGHEYAHHFQDNWAMGQKGEVSNNVFNIISYSLHTTISETRRPTADGGIKITTNGGWDNVCHGFNTLGGEALLNFFGNIVYSFGPNATREVIYHNVQNTYTPKETYSTEDMRWLGTLTKHLKRDFIEYFNSYTFSVTTDTTKYKPEVLAELKALNYKPYHPIALVYASGFVDDNGNDVETARPFRIPLGSPYTFNFVRYVRKKSNMNYDWDFVKVEGGKGTFKEITKGVYEYTPVSDAEYIDKFYVHYRDTSNNDIAKLYVTVRQRTSHSRRTESTETSLATTSSTRTKRHSPQHRCTQTSQQSPATRSTSPA